MFIVPFLAETSVPANVTALAKEGSFEKGCVRHARLNRGLSHLNSFSLLIKTSLVSWVNRWQWA
jgi:hypothetical protein